MQVVERVHWECKVFQTPEATSDLIRPAVWIQVLSEWRGLTLRLTHGLCVSVFLFRHAAHCLCCVCVCMRAHAFTKGQIRQIWLDTQEGPRNPGVRRGLSLPNNQITQNDRKEVGFQICEKTKKLPKGFDWWPLCCQCKLASPQKFRRCTLLFMHA